jgi:hypothetical protein
LLGEPIIAKNSHYSLVYAKYVLNGPFPLGESAIANDIFYSKEYTKDVLKKNFGEPYASFSNTYMFRKNLEKAIAEIDYVGGIKYSSISFFKYEPEISEKIDEFTEKKSS